MKAKIVVIVMSLVLLVSSAAAAPYVLGWSVNYIPGAPSSVSSPICTVYHRYSQSAYSVRCISTSVPSGSYSPYIRMTNNVDTSSFSFASVGTYTCQVVNPNKSRVTFKFIAEGNASISAAGDITSY